MKIVVKGNPLKFLNEVNICEEKWTPSDDQIILDMAKVSSNPWRAMSARLDRSPSACLGRYGELVKENSQDRVALKRRTPTPKPTPKPTEALTDLIACEDGALTDLIACEDDPTVVLPLPRKRSKVVLQRELPYPRAASDFSEDDPTVVFLSSFEHALQHLREEVYATIQPLSQANLVLEQQIKERDDKYSELDSKFTRLHKHIQHVQKEKDDLEAQLHDANDRVGRALSEISAMKQELDRARQQASETLEAMEAEKQQLQNMNN